MDKKLVAAAVAALLVGVLAGKHLNSGPSFADGRADGCNKALDALTGGAVSAGAFRCENRKGELFVVGEAIRGGEASLDAK